MPIPRGEYPSLGTTTTSDKQNQCGNSCVDKLIYGTLPKRLVWTQAAGTAMPRAPYINLRVILFISYVFDKFNVDDGKHTGGMVFFKGTLDLVSTTGGPFYGTTCQRVASSQRADHGSCLLPTRLTAPPTTDGRAALTMRRGAEIIFLRAHYQVPAAQYACLAVLCDGGEVDDVFAAYFRSLPLAIKNVLPAFVRTTFSHPHHDCCGSTTGH